MKALKAIKRFLLFSFFKQKRIFVGYIEWNGYLVRVNQETGRVGFILPKSSKEEKDAFTKKSLASNYKLEELRNLLRIKCHYKTDQAKKEYLINECGVSSFEEFKKMSNHEIDNLIGKIR